MDFKDIVQKRFAVKLFDGTTIPESKIDDLLEIIRAAPSSFNIQPWKIIVIADKELKKSLAPISWNQPQIESSSHLLVFCANSDILGNIHKIESQMLKAGAKKEQIKPYIDMMKGFNEGLTDQARLNWAQRQTYIALGNAVNGAKSLGFDSGPMEGFNPEAYSKALSLPSNIVPVALCAIGYTSENARPKSRLPKEDIFIFK